MGALELSRLRLSLTHAFASTKPKLHIVRLKYSYLCVVEKTESSVGVKQNDQSDFCPKSECQSEN